MAAANVKRRFRITGIQSTDAPGMANTTNRLNVTAAPVGDQANTPAGAFQWPFDDPDGSIAAFFVVNKVVELTFTTVDEPSA